MSNFTNRTSILPNLTNWCPLSVQTFSVITRNDPKMENYPNFIQNLQTLCQRKAQETRNTTVPLPWSKGCCGDRKTQSNSRPILFSVYLSNGEEYAKMDHGNESEGPKMGGGRYDMAWNGRKTSKSVRPTVTVVVAFAGPI